MENTLYSSPFLMSGKVTNQLFINLFIKKDQSTWFGF